MTREQIIAQITEAYSQQPGVSLDQLLDRISQLSDEELFEYIRPEIAKSIENGYAETRRILTESMDKLHEVAQYLIENEKMEGADFIRLMKGDTEPVEE
jgi:ATP-dependent Zn protease